MIRLAFPILVAALVPLALGGCGNDNATRTFGTTRDGQDELRSEPRPPLSVPPVLTQRPQRLAERGAADPATSGVALNRPEPEAAAGGPGSGSRGEPGEDVSAGQGALIDAAGPSAPANIRQRVDQDAQIQKPDQAFSDELLFGPSGPRRTAGGPIIEHESKSWLGSIL
jgi:Protein of unknown function (DUF3035)